MKRLFLGISTALAAAFPALNLHAGMDIGMSHVPQITRPHVPAGHGKRFRAQWESGRKQATILKVTRQLRRAEQRKAMKRMHRGVAA